MRGDRRTGQSSDVTRAGDGATEFGKPFDFIGTKTFGSIAGYEQYAKSFIHEITVPGCAKPGRVFVGQRDESFVVNLGQVFDLVNFVPVDADVPPDQGGLPGGIGIKQNAANDIISDANITTFALELPAACLTGNGNGVIGGWTSASLPQGRVLNPAASFAKPDVQRGAWTQVSRLSAPLVNELVIGMPDKDLFSASEPNKDGQFAKYVTNPTLPALLDVLFNGPVNDILKLPTPIANLAPSNLPRTDLVTAFLTGFPGVNQQKTVTPSEMMRLNTGIAAKPAAMQSTFGVAGNDLAGFPNGRRPGDDVVDLALRVVMGRLCHPVPVNGTLTDLDLCDPAQAPARQSGVHRRRADQRRGFRRELPVPAHADSRRDQLSERSDRHEYSHKARPGSRCRADRRLGGMRWRRLDGGGNNPPPAPAKQAPQIVGLANQTLPQDTSTPVLTFQVSDPDSGANAVTVTATSSDPTIISAAGIVLGGSGANRTLQITPAADVFGNAMITIRAVDPDGLFAQQVIGVTVNGVFVSFTNTLIDIFGDAENGEPRSLRGFTLDDDADDNPNAFDSLLQ